MNRAIALHKITPVIDRTLPYTEARQAIEAMGKSAHLGKIVVSLTK